ncbi:hypothetical protein MSM1_16255 [Mycobacterium sp. SM1]|uniref:hypothetical protein n=1 Tax=Mycobacterium sp. SM1 TaxID=2816243 RepID=UPI001BCBDBF3|nr:hypothetical protein [Mycobacterium sp. SM1]MBS4729832.1 hypothetical protein [Mycobacterium sp. SM1]
MRLKTVVSVAAAFVLAAGGASAGIASAQPPGPPGPPGPTPNPHQPGPPPAPGPKTTIDRDGSYAVGTDIVPGTYSSAGPVGKGTCYWKRVGGPDGNEIVDNAMTKKPQVVQIDSGDKLFKTDGCQPWQKTDSADARPPLGGLPPSALQAILGGLNGVVGQPGAAPPPGP